MGQIQAKPTIRWVKAHANIPLNELADKKAKATASDDNIPEETPPAVNHVRLIHHEGKLIESYPTKVIKKLKQNQISKESHERIKRVWDDQNRDIDTVTTIKLTGNGMVKLNALDATNTNEKAFRIKTINRLLPTLDKVKNYYGLITDSTCRRCKKEEETL